MEHNSENKRAERRIIEKQIKALLKWIPDADMRGFLWVAQQFAAVGLNRQ